MTKHTPGPWKVISKTAYIQFEPGLLEPNYDYLQVVQDDDIEEKIAQLDMNPPNASLIAAAPELLKELKSIRAHILTLDSGALGRSPGGFSYRDEMVNNIGIVLNKTEGKS